MLASFIGVQFDDRPNGFTGSPFSFFDRTRGEETKERLTVFSFEVEGYPGGGVSRKGGLEALLKDRPGLGKNGRPQDL